MPSHLAFYARLFISLHERFVGADEKRTVKVIEEMSLLKKCLQGSNWMRTEKSQFPLALSTSETFLSPQITAGVEFIQHVR